LYNAKLSVTHWGSLQHSQAPNWIEQGGGRKWERKVMPSPNVIEALMLIAKSRISNDEQNDQCFLRGS